MGWLGLWLWQIDLIFQGPEWLVSVTWPKIEWRWPLLDQCFLREDLRFKTFILRLSRNVLLVLDEAFWMSFYNSFNVFGIGFPWHLWDRGREVVSTRGESVGCRWHVVYFPLLENDSHPGYLMDLDMAVHEPETWQTEIPYNKIIVTKLLFYKALFSFLRFTEKLISQCGAYCRTSRQ